MVHLNTRPLREEVIRHPLMTNEADWDIRGARLTDPIDGIRWMKKAPIISSPSDTGNNLRNGAPALRMRRYEEDKLPVGSIWVNSATSESYVLTSYDRATMRRSLLSVPVPNMIARTSSVKSNNPAYGATPIQLTDLFAASELKTREYFSQEAIQQRIRSSVSDSIATWTRS